MKRCIKRIGSAPSGPRLQDQTGFYRLCPSRNPPVYSPRLLPEAAPMSGRTLIGSDKNFGG